MVVVKRSINTETAATELLAFDSHNLANTIDAQFTAWLVGGGKQDLDSHLSTNRRAPVAHDEGSVHRDIPGETALGVIPSSGLIAPMEDHRQAQLIANSRTPLRFLGANEVGHHVTRDYSGCASATSR